MTSSAGHYPQSVRATVAEARARLEGAGIDWRSVTIESRYLRLAEIQQQVTTETRRAGDTFSDKLDRILTHRVWGVLIFLAIMTLMFQSIFTFARWPMDEISQAMDLLGPFVSHFLPAG